MQALLLLLVVVACALFAFYARINGLSDNAVAIGATVISAVTLGYFWRRQSSDDNG